MYSAPDRSGYRALGNEWKKVWGTVLVLCK